MLFNFNFYCICSSPYSSNIRAMSIPGSFGGVGEDLLDSGHKLLPVLSTVRSNQIFLNLNFVQGMAKRWRPFGGLVSQSRQSAKLFLQSLDLGLPQPLTRTRVCPPPLLVPGGRAHSLAREGVGESLFRREDTLSTDKFSCTVLYLLEY